MKALTQIWRFLGPLDKRYHTQSVSLITSLSTLVDIEIDITALMKAPFAHFGTLHSHTPIYTTPLFRVLDTLLSPTPSTRLLGESWVRTYASLDSLLPPLLSLCDTRQHNTPLPPFNSAQVIYAVRVIHSLLSFTPITSKTEITDLVLFYTKATVPSARLREHRNLAVIQSVCGDIAQALVPFDALPSLLLYSLSTQNTDLQIRLLKAYKVQLSMQTDDSLEEILEIALNSNLLYTLDLIKNTIQHYIHLAPVVMGLLLEQEQSEPVLVTLHTVIQQTRLLSRKSILEITRVLHPCELVSPLLATLHERHAQVLLECLMVHARELIQYVPACTDKVVLVSCLTLLSSKHARMFVWSNTALISILFPFYSILKLQTPPSRNAGQ